MIAARHVPWVLILSVTLLLGCSPPPPPTRWTEEVQLGDGSVIRVERAQEWEITQPLGKSRSYLRFATTLTFVGEESGKNAWTGGAEIPLLLDVDNASRELFLITYPENCQLYHARGRPKPAYFEYRYRNDRWIPAALSAAALGREPNLLVYPNPQGEPALISLTMKANRNRREVVSPDEREIGNAQRHPFC